MVCGLILRMVMWLADYYGWFNVFGSGGDTEIFHSWATFNTQRPYQKRLTAYTDVLTIIYMITDCSRLFAQFLNVIFGMGVVIVINMILRIMNLDLKTRKTIIVIVSFMPMLLCFSGILLREAWIEFFIALSLYYFICWFYRRGVVLHNVVMSLICVLLATWMHSGCFVIAVGYFLAFLSYNPSLQKIKFTGWTIILAVILVLFVLFFSAFQNILASRFSALADNGVEETLVNVYTSRHIGGSRYLTWLPVTNPFLSILFAPLKMFYFLFSPLPTEWRGMSDIVAFLLDSSLYLYLSYFIMKNKPKKREYRLLRYYLLTAFLLMTLVFSFGTNFAGTAIRHRAKAISILVIAYAVSKKRHNSMATFNTISNDDKDYLINDTDTLATISTSHLKLFK